MAAYEGRGSECQSWRDFGVPIIRPFVEFPELYFLSWASFVYGNRLLVPLFFAVYAGGAGVLYW